MLGSHVLNRSQTQASAHKNSGSTVLHNTSVCKYPVVGIISRAKGPCTEIKTDQTNPAQSAAL